MIANPHFRRKGKDFWALVRTLSQHLGYTERGQNRIKVHAVTELAQGLAELGLNPSILLWDGNATELGQDLAAYFAYRAQVLNDYVQHQLMNKDEAQALFAYHYRRLSPTCKIPMNKQKGEKKEPSYFTGLINMLIDEALAGLPCNFDPGELTTFTENGRPIRTLARRVDGAFPSPINPIALWEIKEYYFTTTFGSRVADGVYESLLDGVELEEMEQNAGIRAEHYLFVDAKATWWDKGRSYLCRIIDMLHMGYVDEVIFGREVVTRAPLIAASWTAEYQRRRGGLRLPI